MGLRLADYQLLAAFRHELRQFLAFSQQVAQETGLPVQQYQALLAIKGHVGRKRMTVGNLSRELLVTQHSGSELVERLVVKGLLVREPDLQDRRRMLLSLTPAANKILSQMAKTHLEELRRLQPTLIALFQRFGGPIHGGATARAIRREQHPPGPRSPPAARRLSARAR